MKKNARKNRGLAGRAAIDLIEETTHLLRTAPRVAFAWYYLGALPFALCTLYFWADMSRGAFAAEHCGEAAFGVTLLFLWMKFCQAIFAARLFDHLARRSPQPLRIARLFRVALLQSAIQPSKLFALPLAALVTLPLGWTVAFYANATALAHEENARDLIFKARRNAALWPAQNHLALSLWSLFALFVFLNLGVLIFAAPHLLKMLFGIETVFTLSAMSMLNTTFLAVTAMLTYLCCDPLLKAIYVLRCFYGESLQSGEDLRVQLRGMNEKNRPRAIAANAGKAAAILALAFFLLLANFANPAALRAGQPQPADNNSAPALQKIESAELDRAISETMDRPEFSWRFPREKNQSAMEKKMPFLGSLARWLKRGVESLGRLARDIVDWMQRRFGRNIETPRDENENDGGWLRSSRVWMMICIVIVASAAALIAAKIFRERRRRAPREISAQAVAAQSVDLADETVSADQLPENEWLELAREMIAKNELCFGLRALFLAGLAHLAQREIITLAKYKSNRDYERELRRRAAARAPLQQAFCQNVALIERAWYGNHDVTEETVRTASANLEQIRAQ